MNIAPYKDKPSPITVNVGTIGHIDNSRFALQCTIAHIFSQQRNCMPIIVKRPNNNGFTGV